MTNRVDQMRTDRITPLQGFDPLLGLRFAQAQQWTGRSISVRVNRRRFFSDLPGRDVVFDVRSRAHRDHSGPALSPTDEVCP
jgi:hypothetical protein